MVNVNVEKLNNKKVGDTVYLFEDGENTKRRLRGEPLENKIIETTIIKIGRKYLTVNTGTQFDKTINYREKTNYCEDYYLYAEKQDIYDLVEKENLLHLIYKKVDLYNYSNKNNISLDQLRRIKEILDEGLDEV